VLPHLDSLALQTCRKEAGGCGHQYCWICLTPWETHEGNYYHCSRAPDPGLFDATSAASSRHELAVYAFASERFGEHMRGARYADEHRAEVDARQGALVDKHGAELSSVDFLKRATDVIVRGRRVAAWAHVHGFMCSDPGYKALFEDSRGRLEAHLEQLQDLIELHTIIRVEDGTFGASSSNSGASSAAASLAGAGAKPRTSAGGSGAGAAAAGAPAAAAVSSSSLGPRVSAGGSGVATAAAMSGAGMPPSVPRALHAWRQATTNLLGSTNQFISSLLDAVDAGFIVPGAYGGTGTETGAVATASKEMLAGARRGREAAGLDLAGSSSASAKRMRSVEEGEESRDEDEEDEVAFDDEEDEAIEDEGGDDDEEEEEEDGHRVEAEEMMPADEAAWEEDQALQAAIAASLAPPATAAV